MDLRKKEPSRGANVFGSCSFYVLAFIGCVIFAIGSQIQHQNELDAQERNRQRVIAQATPESAISDCVSIYNSGSDFRLLSSKATRTSEGSFRVDISYQANTYYGVRVINQTCRLSRYDGGWRVH